MFWTCQVVFNKFCLYICTMEIWKNIEGYENLYQISSEGRVKSLGNGSSNSKERILKSYKDKDGYLRVSLWKEGKVKKYYIHRLVAQAFIPNPNNLPQVNHKDEKPSNNRVENLEWCDNKYNCNYGTHNERVAKALKNRKGFSKPILQFNLDSEFIRRWNSTREAERDLGFNQSNITKCCKGKLKTAYGYIWMYAVINGVEIDVDKIKKVA